MVAEEMSAMLRQNLALSRTPLLRAGGLSLPAGGRARGALAVRAAVAIPDRYSKVEVRGENILVKVAEAEKQTKGGVLLPGQAQRKPTSGVIPSTPHP